jgi:uncharacterized protein
VTFVDTGAWVALFVEGDARHEAARAWIISNRDRLVTSDYIVDEVLTLIAARYRRQTAIRAGHVLFGQVLAGLIQLQTRTKNGHGEYFDRTAIRDGVSLTVRVSL